MSRRPAGTPVGQPASQSRLETVLAAGLAHHGQRHGAPIDAPDSAFMTWLRAKPPTEPPAEPPERLREEMPRNIFSILPFELLQIVLSYSKGMSCEEIGKLREIDVSFREMLKNEEFWQWQCELRDYDREGRLFPTTDAEEYWIPPTAPEGQVKVPYHGSWREHYSWWCERQLQSGNEPGQLQSNGDLRKNLQYVLWWSSEPVDPHPYFGPIKEWDVSQVKTMGSCFNPQFCNRDISTFDLSLWDVSNVKDMSYMFSNAKSFKSDLSNWRVSNVTNMSYMFASAELFNSNLSKWVVSNVTKMTGMFMLAERFNGDISNWDVSNVKNMSFMFRRATSFNGDLSRWNVSNVYIVGVAGIAGRADNMFEGATSYNPGDGFGIGERSGAMRGRRVN